MKKVFFFLSSVAFVGAIIVNISLGANNKLTSNLTIKDAYAYGCEFQLTATSSGWYCINQAGMNCCPYSY